MIKHQKEDAVLAREKVKLRRMKVRNKKRKKREKQEKYSIPKSKPTYSKTSNKTKVTSPSPFASAAPCIEAVDLGFPVAWLRALAGYDRAPKRGDP